MSTNHYRDEYERSRPRTTTALIRAAQPQNTPPWFAKLLALILLFLCLGLGLLGLVLPILPGLLFFAFAAMLGASLFPGFDKWLRRSPMGRLFTPYLDSAPGFSVLSWRGKLRFVLWMTAKVMVDSLVVLWEMLAKVVGFVSSNKM